MCVTPHGGCALLALAARHLWASLSNLSESSRGVAALQRDGSVGRSRPTIHLAQRERTGGDNCFVVECRAGVAAGWWMRPAHALRLMGAVNYDF